MATTNNKNKIYTDKNFLVTRITKVTDNNIVTTLNEKINKLTTLIKNKHS
jgi:hypothetical protein